MRFNPAALRMEARVTMARPIMKATTGLAWCAGTGSTAGISGVGVAARVEVAVATEESMQRQRRERRGRRREGEGDDGTRPRRPSATDNCA